jgi:hypothetical protein
MVPPPSQNREPMLSRTNPKLCDRRRLRTWGSGLVGWQTALTRSGARSTSQARLEEEPPCGSDFQSETADDAQLR